MNTNQKFWSPEKLGKDFNVVKYEELKKIITPDR